jgi:hypothetical protein
MAKRGRPRKQATSFDVAKLSKGMVRKLTALRKSLGDTIADTAFAQWISEQPANGAPAGDPNAAKLIALLHKHKEIKLPRAGFIVRRGGPKIIVEPAPAWTPAAKSGKRGKRAAAAE